MQRGIAAEQVIIDQSFAPEMVGGLAVIAPEAVSGSVRVNAVVGIMLDVDVQEMANHVHGTAKRLGMGGE